VAAVVPEAPGARGTPALARTALAVLLGASLLTWLLYYTGIDEVVAQLQPLGASAPLVLLPYAVITWCDALGWRCAFPAPVAARVPLTVFNFVRMAGEAVNGLTPSATVGGEPVKVLLLRRWNVPASEAVASLFISKTALTVAQSLFVVLGMSALFVRLHRPDLVVAWLGVLLLATFGFAAGLVWLQRRGPASTLARMMGRLLPRSRTIGRLTAAASNIDQRLDEFYRFEHQRFQRAGAWHFLGWLIGVSEVLVITRLIDAPVSLLDATIIEGLAQVIRATAVVIPGGLGTQEVGGTALCVYLGMSEPSAVALWLLKRAREVVFDAVGLVYFAWAIRGARRPEAAEA